MANKQLTTAKKVGRPKQISTKQLIAIRLEPALLERIKKLAEKKGRPYQSLIHDILEEAV